MIAAMVPRGILPKVGYALHLLVEMYHAATSRVLVVDGYSIVASAMSHSTGLTVVQMWHALGSLKKFGLSILGRILDRRRIRLLAKAMRMHRRLRHRHREFRPLPCTVRGSARSEQREGCRRAAAQGGSAPCAPSIGRKRARSSCACTRSSRANRSPCSRRRSAPSESRYRERIVSVHRSAARRRLRDRYEASSARSRTGRRQGAFGARDVDPGDDDGRRHLHHRLFVCGLRGSRRGCAVESLRIGSRPVHRESRLLRGLSGWPRPAALRGRGQPGAARLRQRPGGTARTSDVLDSFVSLPESGTATEHLADVVLSRVGAQAERVAL